ncbi:3-isopropylmalate dehydratase small subunit [Sphingomonas lenta]|uniref:3-isopropylmalate dehydratase small subunit n=1 Tax=Sphingomonas lenta TaxID=1141887 RepID=A0A2A2SBS2_9SPHN|nr:3-isopropylmalate dehydratase small subunit [Sphingomonas lenta]PAX06754.1 3-isopropylmalate dehydratase small subunit [Sphingomonas lenta]
MTPFTTLTGVAVPLRAANVDTDQIIPARFLKTIKRTGLGRHLFADLRRDPDFVLNRPEYAGAQILIAGENVGCGSSREHASWALIDYGIRCVIAPSFADIFQNNALKNGVLPVALPAAACEALTADAELGPNARLHVDLERQIVVRPNGEAFPFAIDPLRREMLLEGLDDIGVTLRHVPAIEAFEARRPAWGL